jgi:hypothetical protein
VALNKTEYLWKAANALHGETGAERVQWIQEKLRDILESKVGRVIGGLKQITTKKQRNPTICRTLQQVVTYLKNHRHMMDYQTYLQKGYLISTGLVESACGSLVRDRMEQSGMRWTINGAKSILALRAVKKTQRLGTILANVHRHTNPEHVCRFLSIRHRSIQKSGLASPLKWYTLGSY